MLLIDEVFLGPQDCKVVPDVPLVVLGVKVNLIDSGLLAPQHLVLRLYIVLSAANRELVDTLSLRVRSRERLIYSRLHHSPTASLQL